MLGRVAFAAGESEAEKDAKSEILAGKCFYELLVLSKFIRILFPANKQETKSAQSTL